MICTRCDGTGFLNIEQVPNEIQSDHVAVLDWIDTCEAMKIRHGCSCHVSPPCWVCIEYGSDTQVCDCCGDGKSWYGEPGQHYGSDDPQGPNGPYTANGGLCRCH